MFALFLIVALAQTPAVPPATSAEAVITQAVASRLGGRAAVAVHVVAPTLPDVPFVLATPDPMGRVGGEMSFTLTPGGADARIIRVRDSVDVITPHVRASRPNLRGNVVAADDVEVSEGPLTGVPVRRLPDLAQIVGQAALRPIAAGQVVEASSVAVRHLVQVGDTVTVVAIVGSVQVTAEFVAADSGDPGDMIRVTNRDTHRSLRVRVVNKGLVEVINAR